MKSSYRKSQYYTIHIRENAFCLLKFNWFKYEVKWVNNLMSSYIQTFFLRNVGLDLLSVGTDVSNLAFFVDF